jgi:two-component system, OmpR family, phosphate regulon sensor histidine kinase PhoR
MNPRLLRFIIFSIALAMVGLVSIQVYWVTDAYKQRQQQFIESVFKAMNDVLYDYERYRVQKQMERLFDMNQMQDKMVEYMDSITMSKSTIKKGTDGKIEKITIENPRGLTNIFFSSGQYGFPDPFGLNSNDPYMDMPTGSELGLSQEDRNTKAEFLSLHGQSLMETILYDFLETYMKDGKGYIDSAGLDSIIFQKLSDQGVTARYDFAIYNNSLDTFSTVRSNHLKKLKGSDFVMPMSMGAYYDEYMLVLYFPTQTQYLFKNMIFQIISFFVLLVIIILLFYYTIHTIIKQKKVQEIKSDLVNNITHELKTPISTISLACQAMEDPDLANSPLRDKYINMISEENKRLALLVENVLQSAVFEKGDFKLKLKNVDLHLRIEKAVSSLTMQAQNHGIKIFKEFGATKFNVEGDEVMLTNLIFNMVDNAIKYFRPGDSFIKIRTYNNEWNQIIVEVEDNGIGISKEHQQKVFDKLFRVPTGNVHNVKGYGLGLSYVKSIVDHHHGAIDVTSKLGEGSKFIITLPLNQPKEK